MMNQVDSNRTERIRVIDSHTGGEPTRVVVDGMPDLGNGPLSERRTRFRDLYDEFRSAVVNEPRGSDVIVGALLCPPVDPVCVAGVLFFNNVGPLWMCGHGTIGLAVTLGYLGKISAGTHRLETAVGPVTFDYDGANRVSLENVQSYRLAKNVSVDVEGIGKVVGDIAWGGNWFFLVDIGLLPVEIDNTTGGGKPATFSIANVDQLTDIAWKIRQSLTRQGITGIDGAEIDHVELFGSPGDPQNHSRNFVLCPGRAYDRSPCGTGTSAKLACLYADGKLKPGQIWRQESILGSVFEGSIRVEESPLNQQGQNLNVSPTDATLAERTYVIPRITGTAYITADATLILDPNDPFRSGIRNPSVLD